MNSQSLEIDYDAEADILEIFIGEPTPSYFEEIDDDLFEGRDKITGKLKGYKIFNLRNRGKEWLKRIRISLPANVSIQSAD